MFGLQELWAQLLAGAGALPGLLGNLRRGLEDRGPQQDGGFDGMRQRQNIRCTRFILKITELLPCFTAAIGTSAVTGSQSWNLFSSVPRQPSRRCLPRVGDSEC